MEKNVQLEEILKRARIDAKGNYSIYHTYRRMIEELELQPKDFEQAVRKLANILEV